jgi:ERF superfamily protein
MSEDVKSLVFQEQEQGSIVKLYSALGVACANFPDLPRTATGQVGKDRKFQYAPYHKVVRCIKPSLAEQGITFLQPLHTDSEGIVSITLLVAGHGAAIVSTLKFKKNDDVKLFGADCTYHKRYQLTSFFGLEGDPDADDFDDSVVATTTQVAKSVQAESKRAETVATKAVESKDEGQAKNASVAASVSSETKTLEVQKDTRPISVKLTDAMKQLVWKMEDFDKFCKEHSEEFPGFVSASKLPPEGKQKLYDLLVLHKNIAPF